MAGNIVKWWKYKILGRYKPFPVLECPTDSEELMYHQVRAPSSCSAPPDLLLVSDRENNIPLKNPVVNIISSTTTSSSNGHSKSNKNSKNNVSNNSCKEQNLIDITTSTTTTSGATTSQKNHEGELDKNNDAKGERMHLEEFTCDVSVEGGKSSQPLQFSFTFYDLDGHHGKITKDDIVGIVYTIYESIGKSVVVPHCGSKTINVRLTVSPEGKAKSSTAHDGGGSAAGKLLKKMPHHHGEKQHQQQQQQQLGHSRRTHRIRPRKLIKSDDEDDESTSEKDIVTSAKKLQSMAKLNGKSKLVEGNEKFCCHHGGGGGVEGAHTQSQSTSQGGNCKYDNIYENMANLNCCGKEGSGKKATTDAAAADECRECVQQQQKSEQYLKQASSRVKMLRKARKQKYQEHCYESRQRSLSVGNESCWNKKPSNKAKPIATVAANTSSQAGSRDVVDGVIGRPKKTQSASECWNNALKRNDLIDIIRESMEKNRLCFQSNGKPQASVSPLRHRQRSNTVSKIPTNSNNNIQHDNTTTITQENYHHHQPHIPIYHQQMPINPAVLAAQNGIVHSKMNLCGYDSVLHAKICGGGAHHSPPSPLSMQQQPTTAATATTTITTVPTTLQNSPKIYVNNSNLIKSSKILRNGGYQSQQNSPHFNGYQRLTSSHHGGGGSTASGKLNTTMLNSLNPQLSAEEKFHQTINHVEKWLTERDPKKGELKMLKNAQNLTDDGKSKKDVKNFDNLLFAKLTEKLQESPPGRSHHSNKENIRRLHHNSHNQHLKMHRKQQQQLQMSPLAHSPVSNVEKGSKYVTLIPINGDSSECENLIHMTSDDDTLPPSTPTPNSLTPVTDVNGARPSSSNDHNSNSSSMIHRYVHEHIHHHYHHFENKED